MTLLVFNLLRTAAASDWSRSPAPAPATA
jgi:hypothetical protein